ncbi:DUF1707 domain-containing protein [Corynebacterium sp. CCM 8862]|uniref:DUF1707 domain-containing protein n=2 Tax=Corynebacterium mendelii TaxID=2765362 RepID=A0A939E070_9CORY|nr:DUF1707 domain-containing protein [Corynebacterium mendelii]
MNQGNNRDLRVGNADRDKAMQCLQDLYAAGYLTVSEFDERTRLACAATTRGEITDLFTDLPRQAFTNRGNLPATTQSQQVTRTSFNLPEITKPRASGKSQRLGVALISTIGLVAISGINVPGFGFAALLIPVVWILLYVMKVGPASWYQPTPTMLQRSAEQIRQLGSSVRGSTDSFDPFRDR